MKKIESNPPPLGSGPVANDRVVKRGTLRCRVEFILNIFMLYLAGFHLSASVCPPNNVVQMKGNINVAIMFDRRRISSCTCTCDSSASWCSHVVAVCLFRIHQV